MPVVVTYTDDTTETFTTPSVLNDDVSLSLTFAKAVKKIDLKTGLRSGKYTDYTLWYGLFASDVTITNTGQTVANGSTYSADISGISVINSLQHESTVSAYIDTKDYVDKQITERTASFITYPDLTYLSPEMFGAKGDGATDDTSAINQCIAQAITNNLA